MLKTETERWIGGRESREGGRKSCLLETNVHFLFLSFHRHTQIELRLYKIILKAKGQEDKRRVKETTRKKTVRGMLSSINKLG